MYNPNDPHAAFQTLAGQAMLASAAGGGNHNRYSDVSEAPSMASPAGDDMAGYGSPGKGRRKPQKPLSPAPKPPPGGSTNRFSMPPRLDGAPMPELPRPSRPSTQSRRSQQAYAGRDRRSAATAAGGGARRSTARASAMPGPPDESGDIDDLDWRGEEEQEAEPGDARRRRFWRWAWVLAPMLLSLVFVAAGVVYLIFGNDEMVSNLQIWRLCFFIAGLPLIWWVGGGVVLAAVWAVENSKLFRMQNVLYFVYAVRVSVSVANVLLFP